MTSRPPTSDGRASPGPLNACCVCSPCRYRKARYSASTNVASEMIIRIVAMRTWSPLEYAWLAGAGATAVSTAAPAIAGAPITRGPPVP